MISKLLSQIILVFTGDLVPDVRESECWLAGIAPVLQAADITIGHLEVSRARGGTNGKVMCRHRVPIRQTATANG